MGEGVVYFILTMTEAKQLISKISWSQIRFEWPHWDQSDAFKINVKVFYLGPRFLNHVCRILREIVPQVDIKCQWAPGLKCTETNIRIWRRLALYPFVLISSVRRELASESFGPWFNSLNTLKFFRKWQSSSSGILDSWLNWHLLLHYLHWSNVNCIQKLRYLGHRSIWD